MKLFGLNCRKRDTPSSSFVKIFFLSCYLPTILLIISELIINYLIRVARMKQVRKFGSSDGKLLLLVRCLKVSFRCDVITLAVCRFSSLIRDNTCQIMQNLADSIYQLGVGENFNTISSLENAPFLPYDTGSDSSDFILKFTKLCRIGIGCTDVYDYFHFQINICKTEVNNMSCNILNQMWVIADTKIRVRT